MRRCPVVIETHDVDSVEWGISLEGYNPGIEKYIPVETEEDAFRLAGLIRRRDGQMPISGWDRALVAVTTPLSLYALVSLGIFTTWCIRGDSSAWMWFVLAIAVIVAVTVQMGRNPRSLTYSAMAHLIHAGKGVLCPVVIEMQTPEGAEWGISFGGYDPEADKYVVMQNKDLAFKSARLVSCSRPSPA